MDAKECCGWWTHDEIIAHNAAGVQNNTTLMCAMLHATNTGVNTHNAIFKLCAMVLDVASCVWSLSHFLSQTLSQIMWF